MPKPVFESTSETYARAIALRDGYLSWMRVRDGELDERGAAATRLGMANMRPAVEGFVSQAEDLIAAADFAGLPVPIQNDIRKLVAKLPALAAAIDEAADPDAVWAGADRQKKADLVQNEKVAHAKREKVRALVALQDPAPEV